VRPFGASRKAGVERASTASAHQDGPHGRTPIDRDHTSRPPPSAQPPQRCLPACRAEILAQGELPVPLDHHSQCLLPLEVGHRSPAQGRALIAGGPKPGARAWPARRPPGPCLVLGWRFALLDCRCAPTRPLRDRRRSAGPRAWPRLVVSAAQKTLRPPPCARMADPSGPLPSATVETGVQFAAQAPASRQVVWVWPASKPSPAAGPAIAPLSVVAVIWDGGRDRTARVARQSQAVS